MLLPSEKYELIYDFLKEEIESCSIDFLNDEKSAHVDDFIRFNEINDIIELSTNLCNLDVHTRLSLDALKTYIQFRRYLEKGLPKIIGHFPLLEMKFSFYNPDQPFYV